MSKILTRIVTILLLSGLSSHAVGQQAFNPPQDKKQAQEQESGIEDFKLFGNYPNPVRDHTYFKFQLQNTRQVQINLFDLLGNKKRSTEKQRYEKGTHEVEMDVSGLEAGIYFYKIHVNDQTLTHRLNIVKN